MLKTLKKRVSRRIQKEERKPTSVEENDGFTDPIILDITPVSKDTFIDEANPGSNYGAYTWIKIQSASGANDRGLMEFDLSELPADAIVQGATLRLNVILGGTTRTYEIQVIADNTWTELGVNWGNQPSLDPAITESSPSSATGWWYIDVLSLLSINSVIGFRIKDKVEDRANDTTFKSKEEGTSPMLRIVYIQPL